VQPVICGLQNNVSGHCLHSSKSTMNKVNLLKSGDGCESRSLIAHERSKQQVNKIQQKGLIETAGQFLNLRQTLAV